MSTESRHHDRVVGFACVVLCPAISGLFLGLVTIVCSYPGSGARAIELATLVGTAAFVANAAAICVAAIAFHVHAVHRARHPIRI